MSISVTINGADHALPPGATVVDALAVIGISPDEKGIAVALDRSVVARATWASRTINDGARLEVLRAAAGG